MGDGRGGTHIDGVGTIVETSIGEELSGSFLEYAMSVIVSRAIPDVRDGLKPVQRRILYSMWEQGLRSDRQHQKSAKVVGAVMGNYHPHGDCLEGSTEIYAIGGRRWRLDEATNQGLKSLWVWAVTEAGELRAAKAHSFRIGQYATEIYRITLDDGSVIRATANHPFLVATNATGEDGEELEVVEWAKADSLDAGQMLVGGRMEKGAGWTPQRENRIIEAVDVEKLDEAEPMYDFTVDNYENLLIVTSGEAGAERLLVAHNSAIYDAMVRLAQDWVMRVPLVDGQGNFGSPDDSPASSRYTEARLAKAADHLVGDLDENTVDFEPNYDGSTTQPVVLPAKFPNLLVNGANGIAVAMATTIAPHNLREVADGVKLLLAKPQATLGELMKKIPGPDFPTGGMIIGSEGIREAYQTGKGSLRVRGIGHVEELAARRRQIVITELPYGVGPERFIARTAEAVHAKKIDGITGISDHTDRYTGQRIVLTLRAGVNPKAVFAQLYKHTPLEERISLNHVALVDGAPQVVGLKRMLELWVAHAIEVVVRRSQHRLTKAEHRLMLVEGLLKALDMIDEVVATLKRSRNTQTARDNLRKLLKVNEEQANYILEMPLRRLTSLEAKKLRDEAKELKDTIKALKKLLADEKLQREMVATELEEAVGEVGDIERRTKLITAEVEELDGGEVPASVEIADEACVVTLSATGLVGRDQGGRRKPGADDIVVASVEASTRSEVYAVTETGVMYRLAGYETPEAEGRSRGEKAGEVFGLDGGARSREQVVGLFSEKELEAGRIPVFITASGKVKRLDPAQLSKMNAVPVIGLEPGDRLIYAGAATETSDIVFITRGGQVLRTPANKVRPQGRGAAGMAGIGLAEGDVVIGGKAVETGQGSWLVTVVTNGGRVKASALEEHPAKGRATAGVRGIRFLKGEDHLEAAAVVPAAGWAWTDAKNNPLGTTEVAKRDASGEVLEDARGAGAVRANG